MGPSQPFHRRKNNLRLSSTAPFTGPRRTTLISPKRAARGSVVSRTGSLEFRIGFVFTVCHWFPVVVSQYSIRVQLIPEPS